MITCFYCKLPATTYSYITELFYCEKHWEERGELAPATYRCYYLGFPLNKEEPDGSNDDKKPKD